MSDLPEKTEQILQAHTGLIHRVVLACANPALVPDLDGILDTAERNGWTALVGAIRRVLSGARDQRVLGGLDEEDRTILESILRGLQDPRTLPALDTRPDPRFAAPGLAALIHGARRGQPQALQLLANMATQMMSGGGDMARLGGGMRALIAGERDIDKLARGMSAQGRELVEAIGAELDRLEGRH